MPRSRRAAFTLVELCFALGIAAVVLGSMAVSMHREARGLSERAARAANERVAGELLGRVEQELEFAIGVTPQAFLLEDLGAGGDDRARVDATQGFPAWGVLLLEAGTEDEERVAYAMLRPGSNEFRALGRGAQCGSPSHHDKNTLVRWAGMATPIVDQINPLPEDFDGLAFRSSGTVFFRGDGTGFSFRVPVDAAGDGEFLQGGQVQWGSVVAGEPTLDGWSAFYFQAVEEVSEAELGADLDRDGDTDDVYDLGRVRLMSWNAFQDGERLTDVALCAPLVLQRRCDWGGDLDDDGFDDPMFLWEPALGRLSVSLFVLPGRLDELARTRRFETTLYLRNGAWE